VEITCPGRSHEAAQIGDDEGNVENEVVGVAVLLFSCAFQVQPARQICNNNVYHHGVWLLEVRLAKLRHPCNPLIDGCF
jgi:hypothetical protein